MILSEKQIEMYNNCVFLNESILINQKDIYYNKNNFDSGNINLCFITGHSGSGKSTMGRNLSKEGKIEHYELDDVIANWNFSDDNLKEYGDLIYTFFNGPGKKFRYTSKKDWDEDSIWNNKNQYVDGYEVLLIKSFIKYAIIFARSHKNIKFVIEGVWLFQFFEPNEFDDYAFFIKGTSMLISKIRAAKRDSSDAKGKINRIKAFSKQIFSHQKNYFLDEKKIYKFYKYFHAKTIKHI